MIASQSVIDWLLTTASDDSISGAGPLDGAKVWLLTNDQPPNLSWTIDDLVQATFPGYPAGGVEVTSWTVPVKEGTQHRKIIGSSCTFICTGAGEGNSVSAYALVNAAGDELLIARKLENNFLQVAGGNLVIVPAVALPRTLPDVDLVSND